MQIRRGTLRREEHAEQSSRAFESGIHADLAGSFTDLPIRCIEQVALESSNQPLEADLGSYAGHGWGNLKPALTNARRIRLRVES